MAVTNTIKYTAKFADNTTRTFSLIGVPQQELNANSIIAKMNAYNDAWGFQLPDGATKADITGYEDYVAAMSSIFISASGAAIVSLESAQIITENEELIFNG